MNERTQLLVDQLQTIKQKVDDLYELADSIGCDDELADLLSAFDEALDVIPEHVARLQAWGHKDIYE